MNRRTVFSTLTAIAAIMMFGTTNRASAVMANTCCTFDVVASCHFAAACLPISVVTTWAGTPQTDSKTTCGLTTFTIAGCPPTTPATLDAVTVDGVACAVPGTTFIVLACGACARVSIGYDAAGCIRMQISAC